MYKQISSDLLKTIDEGLGGKAFGFEDGRNTLKAYYQQNICAFSAAKSLTEMNYMRGLLADSKDFTDFRNKVFDAGIQFNGTWLKTEYDTFTAAAQMGKQYDDFKKNGVDVLEFTTVGDDRVRPAHAELDGLTFRIDAPFVKKVWPPLDWNCRCHLIPGIDAKLTDDNKAVNTVNAAVKNPLFNHHAGIDKVVIGNNHPYFNSVPNELNAVSNYGLPKVKHLYDKTAWPAKIELGSEEEFTNWWKDQVNIERSDDISMKDKTGVDILFSSSATPGNSAAAATYFKDKLFVKSNAKQWSIAPNINDLVTDPDEVWSIRRKGKVVRYYLKYFNDAPVLVIAKDKAGIMTADNLLLLTEQEAELYRNGELIHVKR